MAKHLLVYGRLHRSAQVPQDAATKVENCNVTPESLLYKFDAIAKYGARLSRKMNGLAG